MTTKQCYSPLKTNMDPENSNQKTGSTKSSTLDFHANLLGEIKKNPLYPITPVLSKKSSCTLSAGVVRVLRDEASGGSRRGPAGGFSEAVNTKSHQGAGRLPATVPNRICQPA